MAYGVGTPADDWIRYQGSDPPSSSKIANSGLASPLTNHGANCRRWNHPTGAVLANQYAYYKYSNPAFNAAKAHSIRACVRTSNLAGAIIRLILKSNFAGGTPSAALFYSVCFVTRPATNKISLQCSKNMSSDCFGDYTNPAVDWVHSPALTNNTWWGLRFDAMRQGDDMRLTCYTTNAPDVLDGSGEPAWVKGIDYYHQLGNNVPVLIYNNPAYSGTYLRDWGGMAPIYSGDAAFVATNILAAGAGIYTHADSIRIKQMP